MCIKHFVYLKNDFSSLVTNHVLRNKNVLTIKKCVVMNYDNTHFE